MSKRVKGITIELGADKTGLDRALKEIESVSRNLNKELRDVNSLLKFSPDSTELVTQKQKLLADQIKGTKEKLDQLRQAEEQVQSQFEKGEINEEQYRAYQREIVETESKLKSYEKALKETGNEQIAFGEKMQAAGEKMKKAGDKMQEVGRNLSMKVTAPILAIGTAGVMAAIDFESGMAGVRKTTDLTAEELDTMGQALRDMAKEIPVSVVELTNLAETAGQLGIEKEHLVDFTRTVADLSVATNILGQEGATDMARFANIMQMSQRDFDRMGSSIVELGNNTATTEKEILNMATRLASSGKQANMTEADVLGIAAGLSALGLEAQAGGTAFSRVINRIQLDVDTGSDDLEGFASIAGMTADQFAQAWEEDAAGALSEFIKGLADTTEHGQSTNEMLEELGIKEIRVSDALRRTSGANELFTKTLKLSNDAWEENNALQQEASIRYETTESKLKIAKNELNDAAIDIGAKLIPAVMTVVEVVTNLVTGFSNLSPKTQDTIVKMALFAAALGPVSSIAGKVSSGIGKITGGIGKLYETIGKGVGQWGNLIDKLSMAPGVMGDVVTSLGSAGTAGLIGGIALAGVAVYGIVKEILKVDPAVKAAREAIDGLAEKGASASAELAGQADLIIRYRDELYDLAGVEEKSNSQKAQMQELVERLNRLVPELNLLYDAEADALNRTKLETIALTDATIERVAVSQRLQMIQDMESEQGKILGDIATKTAALGQLEESQRVISEQMAKTRLTGLTDYDIAMAQSTEQRRKASNYEKELTQEQIDAIDELTRVTEEHAKDVERMMPGVTKSWTDSVSAASLLGTEMDNLRPIVGDLETSFEDFRDEQGKVIEAYDTFVEETYGVKIGMRDLADEVEDGSTKMAGSISDSVDNIEDDLDRFAEAMDMSRDEAEEHYKKLENLSESNKNQMNRFTKERFDYEKGTKDEFLKMWEAEALAFQNYHGNLQKIASRVGPDVAAELAKLGPEAAPLIAQFAEASDEELKKLVLAFETRTRLAAEQAKLELGVLGGTGENAGKALMDGVRRGIIDNQHTVIDASRTTANVIKRALESGLSISSPSKVGIEIGRNFAESLGLGMGRGEGEVDRSAAGLAKTMADAMRLPDLPALRGGNVIDGRTAFAGMTSALTASAVGGDIIIQNMSVRDDNDIRLIARELHNLQQGQKRGRGLA